MMRVCFDIGHLEYWYRVQWETLIARIDRSKLNAVCERTKDADLIIDPRDYGYEAGSRNLFRRHEDNRLAWHHGDRPAGLMKGFYCSLTRRQFDNRSHRTFCYPVVYNELIEHFPTEDATTNWTFYGGLSAPVRRALVGELKDRVSQTNGFIHVQDAQWNAMYVRSGQDFKRHYANGLSQTKFMVCPRGHGTGSIRLFETLQAGRVPVILADDYVLPHGLESAGCAIVMAERDFAQLPEVVERHLPHWPQMAAAARKFWEDNYGDDNMLDNLVSQADDLRTTRLTRQIAAHLRANGKSIMKVALGRSLDRLRK